MKQPYLIPEYPDTYRCSECGVKYTHDEYYQYYSIVKILRYHINCKKCGAIFSEQAKRCYHEEHHPGGSNGCGDHIKLDGVDVCTRQTTHRREELRSWGCYYSCPYYKPPETGPEYTQLSLFEEVSDG